MNGLKIILQMAKTNAVDHHGIQEIPDLRVGSPYRFSVPKFTSRAKNGLNIEPLVLDNAPTSDQGGSFSITEHIDESGKKWFVYK